MTRAPFDWNDLRHFLAVAESGSTLAAGRRLRVSQTTVARRVAALERTLGLALFERRQAGYALTSVGEALVTQARVVERAADGFADAAQAQARDVAGVVRLTAPEVYAMTLLHPILADLHDAHPALRIELDTSDALLDLAAGEADIAFRVVRDLEGAGLVARRIADDLWGIYCSRGYAETRGLPTRRAELPGHPFIGGGEAGVWKVYGSWLAENGLTDAIAFHHPSVTGLLTAVRAGLGLAVLPCFVADRQPDLVRCLPPIVGRNRGVWLVAPERLRHAPRVRLALDFLAERLTRLAKARD
jgi:DNA-binding transcriptional LysR family regulator